MIIFIIGTFAILIFLTWGTYQTAIYLRQVPVSFNLLLLPTENALRLVFIFVCILLGQVSNLPHTQLGWNINLPRDLIVGLGVGLIVALIVPPLTQVAVNRFGKQIYSPIVVIHILPRTPREWLLVPLALVSSVFLEEILFRSLLLGGFGSFVSPILLTVIGSLVFGLMHLPQGTLGMVVAGGLGLLLSVLFLATASLLAPFVAHYVINLVQIIWGSFDKTLLEQYADASSHS